MRRNYAIDLLKIVAGAVATKFISAIAPCIFIVYVIHSNGIFRWIVGWSNVFTWLSNINVYSNIVLTVLAAACLFFAVVLVDWGRGCLLSK